MSDTEERYASAIQEFLKSETPKRKSRLERMDNAYYMDDLGKDAKNGRIKRPTNVRQRVTNKRKA